MIGLAFMLVRMMIWMVKITIGLSIAVCTLMVWSVLAMFLLLPGDHRNLKRTMNSTMRSASHAVHHAL